MTDKGAGRLASRLADRAGQLVLAVLVLAVTAPLWLLWAAMVVVLVAARPFIFYPLALATLGGLVAGAWFAHAGAWTDAAQAGVVAVIAGGLLAAYGAVADCFDSPELRQTLDPPWWWYF